MKHCISLVIWDFGVFAFKDLAKLLRLEEEDFHRLQTLLEKYKKESAQTAAQCADEKDDVLSV